MTSSRSEDASRRLIQSDLKFVIALIKGAATRQDCDESARWLVLSHFQHLSVVAYEVRSFSKRTAESEADTWAHELALAASRHSTKLFNDSQKTHLELLAEFADGATHDRAWYLQNNRAPKLVRALALLGFPINDTSVLLYGGQILCTSHSVDFHAGLGPGTSRIETVERTAELASYLSGLCGGFSEDGHDDGYFRSWRSEDAVAWDARHENLYRAMFPTVPLAEGIALSVLRADLFMLQLMRELVPVSNPLASATFKFRFTGVWQIIETLGAIVGSGATLNLTDQMRDEVAALLSSVAISPMRTRGARDLRNVLVHYGLGSLDPATLDWRDPLLGLPEIFMAGRSWRSADEMLSEQIVVLAGMFESWTEPFEHELKEPHE